MNCIQKLQNHQCRTCYNATKGLKLLTNLTKCAGKEPQKSYAELLMEISNINIMEESYKELPQFICEECSRKLKAAHAFVKQFQEVNERLLKIVRQVNTIKQLDCLQEPEVDILTCVEIKVEHDTERSIESDAQGDVELKIESPDEFEQTVPLNVKLLRTNKRDQANYSKSAVDLTATVNDEDYFNMDTSKEIDVSPSNGEDDYADNSSDDFEWPDEKQSSQSKKNDDIAALCSQCNKIFNNSKTLYRHQQRSHLPEDKKPTCPLCFRKYSRPWYMHAHMRTVHGADTAHLENKAPHIAMEDRIFHCDRCSRSYSKKKHLNVHIKNKHST